MRDIYYVELRKNCTESTKFTAEQMEKVINAIEKVIIFSKTARKEGLLWLEEGFKSLDKETEEKYFTELLMLVVDGIDPVVVMEYALSRYFAANLTGYEGIIYLIYFKGALMIETGDRTEIVEQILEAMLPENMRKLYIKKKREEAEGIKKSEQKDLQDKINSICNKSLVADEKEHTLLLEASLFFENISDQVIQRILREVDNNELTIAIQGLSGSSRRRIFDNISPRIAAMIVEDMECMGLFKMSDVNEAVIKIMNVVLKLAKVGEINDDNLVALKIVMDFYYSDKATYNMYKERYSKLKRALDDLWKD